MTEEFVEKLTNGMQLLIEKAKQKVARDFGDDADRQWLTAYADSYKDICYRLELFVLEGSPSKGYIIADYGNKKVMGFDCSGKKIFETTIQKTFGASYL